jgi:arylsulfatase A-like enzyme/tetratricopeptide (TPR) repeat protein
MNIEQRIRSDFLSRSRFFCILFGLCCLCTNGTIKDARPRDLNLLIITIDTLRADHLGVYGNEAIKTPHIDALAEEGVLFSRAYSHVPLTLPSHCSIFTGNLPLVHGVRDNGFRLPSAAKTLAQTAKERGYATAAFVGAFPLDSRFGLDRGFDVYDDLYGSSNQVRDLAFVERRAEAVNRKAVSWIAEHSASRFFVWIHYFDPHAPYEPPPPFSQEYLGSPYDGEIAYTDSVIGDLLQALDRSNLRDKTLIVLTSDHGEGLGEHKENTHGIFVYDSTLRVPLILSNPKHLPKALTVPEQVGLIDVLPTVLDILGWVADPDIQGRSLAPMLTESGILPGGVLYFESLAPMLGRSWAPLQGIRAEEWKYISAPIPELYDIVKDPGEQSNLVAKYPGTVRRLQEQLEVITGDTSSPPGSEKSLEAGIDRAARRKLLSLGYITGGSAKTSAGGPDPKTMIELDNKFNDGLIASETGELVKARALFEEVLEEQPDFIIGYEYASYNLYKMGLAGEAVRLLESALAKDLFNESILARLGMYYQETGRIGDSIRILEKAVSLDNNYAEAYNYLGVSLFKGGRVAEAIDSFQKSISLDRNYAMAMNNLGNCYLAQERYSAASEEYRRAIAIDGLLASAHNGLASAYYRQGQVEDALQSWEQSLKIDERQTDTLYNLGRAQLRLGRKREALHCFEQFIKYASPQKYGKDIEEVKGVIAKLKKELRRQELMVGAFT